MPILSNFPTGSTKSIGSKLDEHLAASNPHGITPAAIGAPTTSEAHGYANTAESNAKAYTDEQIAAIPTPDVSGQINTHNTSSSAHTDIRQAMPTILLKNW